MKTHKMIINCLLFFACGILFFAYHKEWLIIRHPYNTTHQAITQLVTYKKAVDLIFWHNYQWQTEIQEIIWTDDSALNAQYLVTKWLNVMDEEHAINKKVALQASMIAPSGTLLFLSFDRNLFSKEETTISKLMLIEGLLKTIKKSGIPVQHVQFLVHHQPMHDPHLDFSNPWPISGFLEN